MLFLFGLLLFIYTIIDECAEEREREDRRERRRERERQEERHKELMEAMSRKKPSGRKKVTRTYARDERGRFVAKETVEDVE